MTDDTTTIPSVEDWQHWALVMARAQPDDHGGLGRQSVARASRCRASACRSPRKTNDPMAWMSAGAEAWSKGLEAWSQMLGQYGAGGRAEGPPLRLARMAREPDLRHGPAKLSGDQRQAARHGRGDRGARRGGAQPPALRHQGLRRRDEPGQFHGHQPRSDEADDRDQGREFARRAQEHARRHFARAGDAEPRGRVRAGPQPGDHAGQGDLRDQAVPADPICAVDRGGAGDAAGDLPAVDQPLLHPRPHAREKLRQMDRRPGRDPVHGQLEIGRREHPRRRRWTIMSRRRRKRST